MRDSSGKFSGQSAFLKVCKDCKNEFISKSGNRKWCDSCIKERRKCKECGDLSPDPYGKFCSNKCAGKYKYKNSKKVRENLSMAHLPHNKEKQRQAVILAGKRKKGIPKPNQRKNTEKLDYRNIRHIEMGRLEYKEWREKVFKRDDYTCMCCGHKSSKGLSIPLNADHILPYKYFPEEIYNLDNGRTLCEECHKLMPTTGHKVKTKFINLLKDNGIDIKNKENVKKLILSYEP